MLKTTQGSKDGFSVDVYKEGEVYIIGESLYKGFLSLGACKLVNENKKTRSRKKINPVEENKSINEK